MRAWLSLALLAAVVAALGAWLHFKPRPQESETHATSALKASDVKRIRVEREPNVTIALERRDGAWRMTQPFAARADAFQVNRLLMVLDARSAVRYPATDLARYGLDKPMAKLTIEDQVFTFGAYNATTSEQYVLIGDSIYAIGAGPGTALPRDPQALLSHDLFGPQEILTRIELPEFTAALEQGKWQVNPPEDASADERAAWVDAWQHASALRIAHYEGALPGPFIRVTLKSGAAITLGIAQREPELVLVRVDENIAYHFVQSVAKRLLSRPGTKP